jgi:hypothetical protein
MNDETKDAWNDLDKKLEDGETIEAIVFGAWGWSSPPDDDKQWKPAYGEPSPPPVPFEKRGVILSAEEGRPLMKGWSFFGGYGSPEAYAIRVWTNRRVIWVTQYDGSTWLSSAPRNPTAHLPDMPGG